MRAVPPFARALIAGALIAPAMVVAGCRNHTEDRAAPPDATAPDLAVDVGPAVDLGVAPDIVAGELSEDGPADSDTVGDGVAADAGIEVVLPPGAVRVVLVTAAGLGIGQGYEISTNRVVESVNGACAADADFCLLARQIVSLAGCADSAAFCKKGTAYTSVLDIPTDSAGCSWGVADLGGNGPFVDPWLAGAGFLARNRAGVPAARLVIVSRRSFADDHHEVTFDLARIEATRASMP